jgi:tyrosine-protein phosphatase YwqE
MESLQWEPLRYERTDGQNEREKDRRMDMTRLIAALHHYEKAFNNPKVKVKVKVKFTLEQATKTQRGSRGAALLFL